MGLLSFAWFPELSWATWAIVLLALFLSFYMYSTWNYAFFKELGIPYEKPYPLVGNFFLLARKGMSKMDPELVEKHGKVVGTFFGRQPVLLVADLGMIKSILVKDFDAFTNRSTSFNNSTSSKVLKNMLTTLKDEKWKTVRNTISPAFSSGKLKLMTKEMNACAKLLVDHLHACAVEDKAFDPLVYTRNFTMDTIARVAFGIQIDSQGDQESQFVKMANKFIIEDFKNILLLLAMFLPWVAKMLEKYFKMHVFSLEATAFFESAVQQAAKRREGGDQGALDLLQLMLNAHNLQDAEIDSDLSHDAIRGRRRGLTEDEVLSQGILFFLAAFDTTSLTLMFACYNLATNPECQQRLRREVIDVMGDREDVTVDDLHKLSYLKQVVEETIRLYPLAQRIERQAGRDVEVDGVLIPEGTLVQIPVWQIHHDPEIYPDPETFDPDRFSTEEKSLRDPFAYLGFGMGPRNCVGMRLAFMETQIALARLIHHHRLVTCAETEVPVQLKPNMPRPQKPIKLKLEVIKEE